jgi:hypothetical protein
MTVLNSSSICEYAAWLCQESEFDAHNLLNDIIVDITIYKQDYLSIVSHVMRASDKADIPALQHQLFRVKWE